MKKEYEKILKKGLENLKTYELENLKTYENDFSLVNDAIPENEQKEILRHAYSKALKNVLSDKSKDELIQALKEE